MKVTITIEEDKPAEPQRPVIWVPQMATQDPPAADPFKQAETPQKPRRGKMAEVYDQANQRRENAV